MENTPNTELPQSKSSSSPPWKTALKNTSYFLLALFIFLFALDIMIASLQRIGQDAAEVIILATSNPFTGLFIGLLATALIQSSSATTTMMVALIASGSLTLESAIPILMGANIGTTITSTIVSLGFITSKKEFRRALTIGTYHDFFNILTVTILFPLEYYFGFLSGLARRIATNYFAEPLGQAQKQFSFLGNGFNPIVDFIVDGLNSGFLSAIFSLVLLFGSILFFRRILSRTFGFGSQDRFQHFFFKNSLKSFGWGLLTTATIRSSTVTTSLVVPLVAKKVIKIKSAFPFVLGANIGTTITAFIAAMFNSNTAISIAIAHFLFNAIGVSLFSIPYLKEIPIKLAAGLGRLTLKYRLVGFLYILLTFFFIPFSLIYFNKDSVSIRELTYRKENLISGDSKTYSLISKTYLNQPISNWSQIESPQEGSDLNVMEIYRRKKLFLLNNELFELNKPGFCHDGEDQFGKFKICIDKILPSLSLSPELSFDSVFVFEKQWYQPELVDSITQKIYISANQNLLIKKELYNSRDKIVSQDQLIKVVKR
jgi:sodium-dependent phosphate cotransporter